MQEWELPSWTRRGWKGNVREKIMRRAVTSKAWRRNRGRQTDNNDEHTLDCLVKETMQTRRELLKMQLMISKILKISVP